MRLALILVCLLFLFAAPALADLPPPLPHSVHGAVDIPAGWLIEAWGELRGHRYATSFTFWHEDSVVFALTVPGDDPTTEEVEGATLGEIVTFFAENVGWAAEKIRWVSGTSELLDLHFEPGGEPSVTPTPSPSQLRLVIEAPIWRDGGQRGSIRICACYAQECVCANVELETP